MGYDARVHCRCFQDGKIPHPYFADFIKYDEYGLYIYLPKELEQNQEKSQEIFIDFYDWIETACNHKNMHLSNQDVANIPTMNKFKYFIATHKDNYPILYQYLPTVNAGIIPAKLAKPLLKELHKLENAPERQGNFDCILKSLTQVAKASIQTGNPINHTNLLTLTNTHLNNLFKHNGNDEWFMAEFPYELDKVDRYWQIDECHINPSLNSTPMILAQCQLIYQNLTVATYRLYFDTNYQVIDEFFVCN